MQGFQQAAKLEDTPLPFPYAQARPDPPRPLPSVHARSHLPVRTPQFVSYALFGFLITYPLLCASKAPPSRHPAATAWSTASLLQAEAASVSS